MQLTFDLTDTAPAAVAPSAPAIEQFPISPWLAMSALQKGIRRADAILSQRAAATLLRDDPARLWRRLCAIAFEDIGLADLDTVRLAVDLTAGKRARYPFGGEWAVASRLVQLMCAAPKCRAADDLFVAVQHHPSLADLRTEWKGRTLDQHLNHLRERGALLGAALAALHASGALWRTYGRKRSDATAMFEALGDAGVEPAILELCQRGFRRTGEALPIMMALASLALPTKHMQVLMDDTFPPVALTSLGLPTFCLDGFSREGRAALARFLHRQCRTTSWLEAHAPADRRLLVLAGALFRIEGALVRKRTIWPTAQTLRRMADQGFHGIASADGDGLLTRKTEDSDLLNQIRCAIALAICP